MKVCLVIKTQFLTIFELSNFEGEKCSVTIASFRTRFSVLFVECSSHLPVEFRFQLILFEMSFCLRDSIQRDMANCVSLFN